MAQVFPLLEKVRVLCADIERRRFAVANCLAAAAVSSNATTTAGGGAGGGGDAAAMKIDEAAGGAAFNNPNNNNNNNNLPLHENVAMVRDHFILRQCDAVREASSGVLDALDGEELARLATLFVEEAGLMTASRLAAAHKAVDEFDLEAASLREYHRQHAQSIYTVPSVERPGDRDVHKVRTALFRGPERHGRAVDLTAAFRHLSEFLEASAADDQSGNNTGARVANTSTMNHPAVVHRDIGIDYPAFVSDPIGECARIPPARKLGAQQALYRSCLQAAVSSVESFVSKTKPLTAEAELGDVRTRAEATLAQLRRSIVSAQQPQQQHLVALSAKVRTAWRDYISAAAVSSNSSSSSTAHVRKLAQMFAAADGLDARRRLAEIASLEEHLLLLCENCAGEQVLAASAEHIRRVALRSTAEEQQEEDDDETRFQQDLFYTFYATKPLSDCVELTITSDDDLKASSSVTAAMAMAGRRAEASFRGATDAAAGAGATSSMEEEERLKNPKDFPLDPLGNPIPVWMWKLHQLGKKFFCEVCGFTYAGEKNYAQHFMEPRHERGLERLGVRVTARTANAFKLISTREGALAAQRKIEEGEEQARRRLRGDDEEIEDATGTVATRAQQRTRNF